MGHIELEAEEREIAIDAIRMSRAQWVVDHIATELGERAVVLREREASLLYSIKRVRRELSIIDKAFGVKQLPPESPEARKESYQRANLDMNEIRKTEATKPPYSLNLKAYKKDGGANEDNMPVGLWPWFKENRQRFEELYGLAIATSAERLMNGFARRYGSVKRLQELIRLGDVEEVIYQERPEEEYDDVVLKISNPGRFFDAMRGIGLVGPKAAVAFLCIADMQRAEQQ